MKKEMRLPAPPVLPMFLFLLVPQHAHSFDCRGAPGRAHPNGGGFVANTAHVEPSVYLDVGVSVCDTAKIYGKVYISGFSKISDQAAIIHEFPGDDGEIIITGHAQIYGDAILKGVVHVGDAEIYGRAQILGFAKIDGDAQIYGEAIVKDYAYVSGKAEVGQNAVIEKWAVVTGAAWIHGNALITGAAHVTAEANISENARLSDNAQILGPATIRGDVQIKGIARVFGGLTICGSEIITSDVFGNESRCTDKLYLNPVLNPPHDGSGHSPG